MMTPTFSEVMRALTGPQLIAVRDEIRHHCQRFYAEGLAEGKRQCLSSIWGLDPDSAEIAQHIAELADPLPATVLTRRDRGVIA